MIPYSVGKKSSEHLKEFGLNLSFNTVHGMAHSADIDELKHVVKFLNERIPPS